MRNPLFCHPLRDLLDFRGARSFTEEMEILYPVSTGSHSGAADSVTALVHCAVPVKSRNVFEAIYNALLAQFRCASGTISSDIFEQKRGEVLHLTIVQRFATLADHNAWLQSEAFAQWKTQIAPFQTDAVQRYYGLEVLFGNASDAPPRWKMYVVLTFAAIPISWALSAGFGPTLASISPLTGALVTSPVMVFLMTYVMTPLLSRLFSGWLTPSSGKTD